MLPWTSAPCRKLTDFSTQFIQAAKALSAWEIAAVLLALAYLVLAIREHVACWLAAIFSTGIYLVLMFRAGLYMESALQVFYIAMAVYGWYSWKHGAEPGEELRVSSWPLQRHVLPVLMILVASTVSGYLLARFTNAAMPYLDSFTTWGAIVSTWMVARKIIQNWHYWFVIDSVSVYLYLGRGLYLTALLFMLYLVLIVIGLQQWKKHLDAAPA
jgi:nicotinamide mononucleotide transporter